MDNTIKRSAYGLLIAMLLALCVFSLTHTEKAYAADTVASGTCGYDMSWSLDASGTLSINGTGDMYNYYIQDVEGTRRSNAPWGTYEINKLVIGNGITSIGNYAFFNLENWAVDNLALPDSLISIGKGAFEECHLKSVSLPNGLVSMGEYAFERNDFTEIVMPNSLESLGAGAFMYCFDLKDVTFSERLTEIKHSTFWCDALTELNLPSSVTTVGRGAFLQCDFKTLVIPEGLTSVGDVVFAECDNLETVIIPDTVTEIVSSAFNYCSNLKTIIIPDSVTSIYDNNYYGADIYVFKGSYADQVITSTKKKYIDFESQISQEKYLDFVLPEISIEEGGIIDLNKYIISSENIDLNDAIIQIGNTTVLNRDNEEVAGIGCGSTNISISYDDMTCTMDVNVVPEETSVPISEISFNNSVINLEKGTTAYVKPMLSPSNTTERSLTWSTSNKKVATVSGGKITATGTGNAVIRVAYNDSIYAEYTVNVSAPLGTIIIPDNLTNLKTVERGATKKLIYYLYPFDTTDDSSIRFESSDPNVISIDNNGIYTANKTGEADISITKGECTTSIHLTVVSYLADITISKKSISIQPEEQYDLDVEFEPADATDVQSVEWTSNKESVATVDNNGLVTAHAEGFATITVTVNNAFSKKCTVVVKNDIPMTGISLDNFTLKYGESKSPEVVFEPDTTTDDKSVTFTSGNEAIIKVINNKSVKAVGVGTTTLTVTCGSFSDTCSVTVDKADPDYIIPSEITATCKTKLSEINLPEGFSWVDDSQSVGSEGKQSFKALFTPSDTTNYNIVEDIDISITISHNYAEKWSSDNNTHWHECACGAKDSEAEHSFDEWIVTKEPSCIMEGEKQRTCSVCDYTETGSVEANGHDWFSDYTVDKEATCMDDGEKSIHCKNCDETKNSTRIAAFGHSYAETVVEPTCSQKGYTLHVCGRCADSYTDSETAAKGHTFGDWITDSDSTCTSEGIQHHECSVCGYTETKGINKKEHSFSTEYTVDKEATCTTDGSKSYHCTAEGCSATTGSVVIPATGHQYTEWKETKTPTCTEDGDAERSCTVCGARETIHFEARGHIWMKTPTVDKASTCTEEGSESIHCAVCDARKPDTEKTIAKVDHSWDLGKITTEPTYQADGVKTYTCSACGTTKTESVPKLAKKANTITVKVKATTVKYTALKKKNQTITAKKVFTVSNAKGKVTYKKTKGNAKITLSSAGKFTVKKGLKKGTYKVTVKVTAAGTTEYKAGTKTVTVKIKIK